MPDENSRVRTQHPHSDLGGARQEERNSADINRIVAQYQRSGTMPAVARSNPLYGDFTLVGDDLMEITEMFANAEDRFFELPSQVRAAADNDWRRFLQLYDSPEGLETLRAAGLEVVDDQVVAEPPPAEPVDPPAEPVDPPISEGT